METAAFTVRRADRNDIGRVVELLEAVAAEGKWIGTEIPLDREQVHRRLVERGLGDKEQSASFLAEAGDRLIGNVGLSTQHGVAELGMMVAADWRGRGVGSTLMRAGVEWARNAGAHKMALQVWPHNLEARRLYRNFGFVDEGRLRRHWRRRNGDLWDSIVMGLVLDTAAPGSPYTE